VSEEKHIDEFFKSVLDKPLTQADPASGWAAFEKMSASTDSGSATKLQLKYAWMGALASFLLMTLVSVFQTTHETELVQIAEHKVVPLSILRPETNVASIRNDLVEQTSKNEIQSETQNIESVLINDAENSKELSEPKVIPISAAANEVLEANILHNDPRGSELEDVSDIDPMSMKAVTLNYESTDHIASLEAKENEDPEYLLQEDKHKINLLLASNVFDGVVNAKNNRSPNAFQSIGVEYQYALDQHFALSASMLYSHVAVSGFETFYDSREYSFGSAIHRTGVKPEFMRRLSVPLGLTYGPKAKHEVNLSAELSYLLDVHSELNQSVLGHENETPVIREDVDGYRQGFNNFNARAMLSYRYNINPALQLGVTGRYDLSDPLVADYFDRKRKVDPFNWQIQIAYNLTRLK